MSRGEIREGEADGRGPGRGALAANYRRD